ncbi:MAG: response regulator [Candidatus Riflebacteria bacterium]|nr:response regulator [Candidatus Riflebacteria bacterium]
MNPLLFDDMPQPSDLLPGRVLLVEDDDLQAKLMAESIRTLGQGWSTIRVPTAKECLQTLENMTFAVALIDLQLPDASGLDILRQIRERGWSLATVLVTAHGSEQVAVEALRLGVSDYLKKEEGYLKTLPDVVSRTVKDFRQRLRKLSAYSRLKVELTRRTHRNLLDSYTAPIVHDIKSPLTYITVMAEVLQMGGITSVNPQEAARVILKGTKAIGQLVDRLLKFARQEVEDRISLDLTQFLSQMAQSESQHLKVQNVRLVAELPAAPTVVKAARGGLEQVFLNLVANASECLILSAGGGQISLGLTQEDNHGVVTVSDNGPGIPEEALPHLFKAFSTYGKTGRGTGLGLSIVAGIVWEHGGQIKAENLPAGGARFTVRLPLERRGPVALVLEDEPNVQELVITQLEALGVRAETFIDGADVLAALEGGKWELVILDLRTPGVSGIDVFQAMVQKRPDLVGRTMVVSGSIEDRALQELLATHPVPCLPKPYSVSDFNNVVRLLLRASGST